MKIYEIQNLWDRKIILNPSGPNPMVKDYSPKLYENHMTVIQMGTDWRTAAKAWEKAAKSWEESFKEMKQSRDYWKEHYEALYEKHLPYKTEPADNAEEEHF